MKELVILSEALKEMGFNLDGLTFYEMVALQVDIKELVNSKLQEHA